MCSLSLVAPPFLTEETYKPSDFEKISISSFGPLDIDSASPNYGKLRTVPSIKKRGWKDSSIVSLLKEVYTAKDIQIQTDVNASAFSEFKIRESSGITSLAYITVGTGIGVGLVVNSKPVIGLMHPEGGHVPLLKNSTEIEQESQSCNFHQSCVEGYSTNIYASRIIGVELDQLKNHADHPVFQEIGKNIGQLCATVCLMTSVEKIIIGGGLSQANDFLKNVKASFKNHINGYIPFGVIPEDYIELCKDFDKVGITGAAYLSI